MFTSRALFQFPPPVKHSETGKKATARTSEQTRNKVSCLVIMWLEMWLLCCAVSNRLNAAVVVL